MNTRINSINISEIRFKPVSNVFSRYAILKPVPSDTFVRTSPKEQKTVSGEIKDSIEKLFNKVFKKVNVNNNYIEGVNIEKCEDAELLSPSLVNKIKESGDIFTTKDLFQMQEMHELGIYSTDDILKYGGSDVKLTNKNMNINFKKEAELTNSLEEYVENISGFVNKEPQALEVSSRNIDKYISLKGEIEFYTEE